MPALRETSTLPETRTIDVAALTEDAAPAVAPAKTAKSGGLFGDLYRRITGTDSEALNVPGDPTVLPPMTEDLYRQLWPQAGDDTAVPSHGASERGLAVQSEDISAVGGKRGKIVRAAQALIGLPYVWGGTSATRGVDCSGLVQLAYAAAGINVPRVSADQVRFGHQVDLKDLQPGDIVGFDNSSRNNGADHVAVYLGGGRIIEAARPGTDVRIRRLGDNEGAIGVRILGGN